MKKLFICVFVFNFQSIIAQFSYFQLSPCSPHSICDQNVIVEVNPHGKIENGMREGIWTESYYGKPYAKGKYSNGKRDSIWTYYNILSSKQRKNRPNIDTSLKNKIPSEKDFRKATIFSTFTFRNGKLNGRFLVYYKKISSFTKGCYRNDTLIDTLFHCELRNKEKCSSILDYNNCYYESTFAKENGISYYDARLFYSVYTCYTGKNSYYQFKGYTNGNYYLEYDKKRRGVFISVKDIYDQVKEYAGVAEGVYSYYEKGRLVYSYAIEDGRRTKVNE